MTEIYILTSGSYSSYSIYGVYDTEAKAEEVAALVGCEVETWELNAGYDRYKLGFHLYNIRMLMNGDTVGEVTESIFSDKEPFVVLRTVHENYFIADDKEAQSHWTTKSAYRYTGELELNWRGYAKSKEHAIKIVNELRTQLIAENKWVFPKDWVGRDIRSKPLLPDLPEIQIK